MTQRNEPTLIARSRRGAPRTCGPVLLALAVLVSAVPAALAQRAPAQPTPQPQRAQTLTPAQLDQLRRDFQACWDDTGAAAAIEAACNTALAPRSAPAISNVDAAGMGRLHYHRGKAREQLANFNGAIEDFRAAADRDYNAHRAHARIGTIYLNSQPSPALAVDHFRKALAIDANFQEARIGLAVALSQTGDFAGSAAEYRRAIALDPNNATLHRNLGISLYQARLVDDAIKSMERALALKPDDAETRIALIQLQVEKDLDKDALRNLDTLVAAKPNDPNTLVRAGTILTQLRLYDRAIASCAKAISVDEAFTDAYVCRGLALANQGHVRPALDDFNRALQRDDKNPRAYVARGYVHKKSGNFPAAIADLQKAITLDPASEDAHRHLISVYTDAGQLPKALEAFDAAQRLNRNDPWSYVLRAFVWALNGDRDNALRDIDQAFQIVGDKSSVAFLGRGAVYYYIGDVPRAASELQQAIRLNRNDGYAHALLGRVYLKRGDLTRADQELAEAQRLLPSEWQVFRNLGLVALERRNFEQARTMLSRSIDLNGAFAEPFVARGRAYEGMRNLELARLQYQLALTKLDYDVDGREAKAFARQRLAALDQLALAPPTPPEPPRTPPQPPAGTPPNGEPTARPLPPKDDQIGSLPPGAIDPGRPQQRDSQPVVETPQPPRTATRPTDPGQPWYCGLVKSWSGHSQRYTGVRVDLGCERR